MPCRARRRMVALADLTSRVNQLESAEQRRLVLELKRLPGRVAATALVEQ